MTGARKVRLDFSWSISGGNKIEVSRPSPGTERVTITAKVDDITDTLTIKVRTVNGKDPLAANVRISAINETPPPDNTYGFDRFSGELYHAAANSVVPASIWGAPVTSVGDDIKLDLGKDPRWGLMIPDSVKRIGKNAIKIHPTPIYIMKKGENAPSFARVNEPNSPLGLYFTIGADVSLQQNSIYTDMPAVEIRTKEHTSRGFYRVVGGSDLFEFTDFYNKNGKKAGMYTFAKGYTNSFSAYEYQWFYKP